MKKLERPSLPAGQRYIRELMEEFLIPVYNRFFDAYDVRERAFSFGNKLCREGRPKVRNGQVVKREYFGRLPCISYDKVPGMIVTEDGVRMFKAAIAKIDFNACTNVAAVNQAILRELPQFPVPPPEESILTFPSAIASSKTEKEPQTSKQEIEILRQEVSLLRQEVSLLRQEMDLKFKVS